jgi:hypothetical protein
MRTDMTKLIVAFRNFANAPKNGEDKFIKNGELGAHTQHFNRKNFSDEALWDMLALYDG